MAGRRTFCIWRPLFYGDFLLETPPSVLSKKPEFTPKDNINIFQIFVLGDAEASQLIKVNPKYRTIFPPCWTPTLSQRCVVRRVSRMSTVHGGRQTTAVTTFGKLNKTLYSVAQALNGQVGKNTHVFVWFRNCDTGDSLSFFYAYVVQQQNTHW